MTVQGASTVQSYSVQSFETLLVESGLVQAGNVEQGGYNDPLIGYVPGSLDMPPRAPSTTPLPSSGSPPRTT